MPRPQVLDYEQRTLNETLTLVRRGKLVLPYFQRNYVWKTDQIRKLLSSLFTGLPIGSTLVLVGDDEAPPQFVYREIEGASKGYQKPKYYLLDGQQRLTSLYSVFADLEDLSTTKTRLNGRWFLRLQKILEQFGQDTDDIVFDRIEPEELEPFFEPFHKSSRPELFDQSDLDGFLTACHSQGVVPLDLFWPYNSEREKLLRRLVNNIAATVLTSKVGLDPDDTEQMGDLTRLSTDIRDYISQTLEVKIPSIEFKTKDFQKAIQSFEIVNTGGTKLHTFDLLVARAGRAYTDDGEQISEKAVDDFHETVYRYIDHSRLGRIEDKTILRKLDPSYPDENWDLSRIGISTGSFDKTVKDQIVNFMTVFGSEGAVIKNTYYFNLKVKEAAETLVRVADLAMTRFVRVMAFLNLRCGVRAFKSLPYKLITLPLAYALDDSTWGDEKRLDVVEGWFWIVTLSGRYMTSQNEITRFEIFRLRDLLLEQVHVSTDSTQDSDFQDGSVDTLKLSHIINVHQTFESVLTGGSFNGSHRVMRKPINANMLLEISNTEGISDVIHMYLLRRGAADMLSGAPLHSYDQNIALHDHHIVPIGSASSLDESAQLIRKNKKDPRNSVLNRTLITAQSNQKIRDKSPNDYFREVDADYLRDHFIPYSTSEELKDFLAADETHFRTFANRRYEELRRSVYEYVKSLFKRAGRL